jgi:hypothetical protein
MAKKTIYNWNNVFVQCGNDHGCVYRNKICFNPSHMSVKNYESHFKGKSSIITTHRFKKFINSYLPGDNVLYAIIEQTRFFKKKEIEIIVKTWEENWMSGAWNDAISHADEVLEKQEYFSLVKIVLNYVRLFISSDAKYATQDYIKAVMLQDYVGDVFTEEHYNTLTKPWLTAKRAAKPHLWSYKNRHLNVDTVDLTEISKKIQTEIKPEVSTQNMIMLDTEPDFVQDDFLSGIMSETANVEEYNFWEGEVLVPTQYHENSEKEKENIDISKTVETIPHENFERELVSVGSSHFESSNTTYNLEDTQDYTYIPEVLKTKPAVQNILKEIDEEKAISPRNVIHNVKKTVDNINLVDNVKNAATKIKEYLGYGVAYQELNYKENSATFSDINYNNDNYNDLSNFEVDDEEVEENYVSQNIEANDIEQENINVKQDSSHNNTHINNIKASFVLYGEESLNSETLEPELNYEHSLSNVEKISSNDVEEKLSELPEHLRDALAAFYIR